MPSLMTQAAAAVVEADIQLQQAVSEAKEKAVLLEKIRRTKTEIEKRDECLRMVQSALTESLLELVRSRLHTCNLTFEEDVVFKGHQALEKYELSKSSGFLLHCIFMCSSCGCWRRRSKRSAVLDCSLGPCSRQLERCRSPSPLSHRGGHGPGLACSA
jgi:hypothetical protein